MRNTSFLTVCTAASLLAPSLVSAAILDFAAAEACQPEVCSNGRVISQSYGDLVGVDVIYDTDMTTPEYTEWQYWDTAYSALTDIAYAQDGATISFYSLGDFEVSLSGLDLGAWPNSDRQLGFAIFDLNGNVEVFNSGLVTVLGTVASSFTFDLSSTLALQIRFFGDVFNGGVDNIVYDAVPTSTIPLPASALLLAGGLVGLGALRRRRRT